MQVFLLVLHQAPVHHSPQVPVRPPVKVRQAQLAPALVVVNLAPLVALLVVRLALLQVPASRQVARHRLARPLHRRRQMNVYIKKLQPSTKLNGVLAVR